MADISVNLDNIKPLLSSLGLGQAPPAPPKVDQLPAPQMPPPGPPPPTPAVAGFSQWMADPRTQEKVASGITLPGTALMPPPAPMASVNPPQQQYASMNPPGSAPTAGAPPAPSTPSPSSPAPIQTQDQYFAAHPDQLQHQMGTGGKVWNAIAAGLIGAAGGIRGNPTAGTDYARSVIDNNNSVGARNNANYNAAVIQPLQSAQALAQGKANLDTTQQNLTLAPQKAQLAQDAQDFKENQALALLDKNYAAMGFKQDLADDGTPIPGHYSPDPNSPITKAKADKDQLVQAQIDSTNSQKELRDAQTAFTNNKSDPTSLVSRQVAQRLATAKQNANTAAGRLNQSTLTYQARYLGTGADGQPLEGAMLADDGRPVGSAMSANVRPTGTERNKADMASSADEQLGDIKAIMQKHPDMFGPGYGQTSQFRQWTGSQDPDAQRFMAARTIAADHLAGTFGGRSEAALTALDNAIGQFKDNPTAAIAGVDQLTKANSRFQKAGTVRTAGSNAAKGITPAPTGGNSGGNSVATPDGVVHTFPNAAAAAAFKKAAKL